VVQDLEPGSYLVDVPGGSVDRFQDDLNGRYSDRRPSVVVVVPLDLVAPVVVFLLVFLGEISEVRLPLGQLLGGSVREQLGFGFPQPDG